MPPPYFCFKVVCNKPTWYSDLGCKQLEYHIVQQVLKVCCSWDCKYDFVLDPLKCIHRIISDNYSALKLITVLKQQTA